MTTITDKEIDYIFDIFDELFLKDQFEHADFLLKHLAPLSFGDKDFLLTVLTVTLPAKDHLSNRPLWVSVAKKYLPSDLIVGLV
jgi:hypothetical protein